ncbi:MAG: type II secretion system protein GspL [Thiogranum sp.]|nr:type II secretion system protein GspL [Thiogranum sp.]
MAEILLIRMAADAAGFRDWLLADEQGQARSPVQAGAPDEGVVSATPRIIVLVPGAEVLLTDAQIPGRNRQRALRAIPYALEERLATDVDSLHFALGPVQDGDRFPVAVVDRSRMDAWAALLQDRGILANQWIPDVLALPVPDSGSWSLMVDEGMVLVRSAPYAGFASETASLTTLVSLFAAREEVPAGATVYGATLLDLEGVETGFSDTDQGALEILARGWAQGSAIDLLQGAYSRSEQWGRLLRPWKASAALLLAAILLGAVIMGVDYTRLSAAEQQLNAQIEAVYRQTFPDAKRVVNPRAQMEQQLKQLQRRSGGGDTGFMTMLGQTGEVLRATRGIDILAASYRDGRLDLELRVENLQILDQLKQALAASGRMNAEIQSATTQEGQKVQSRIRIQGTGA